MNNKNVLVSNNFGFLNVGIKTAQNIADSNVQPNPVLVDLAQAFDNNVGTIQNQFLAPLENMLSKLQPLTNQFPQEIDNLTKFKNLLEEVASLIEQDQQNAQNRGTV